MAAATGLVIIKRMPYRGQTDEEFSNKYWLEGAPPQSSADWQVLFDLLAQEERKVYPANVHQIGGIGYADNSEGAHAAWTFQAAPGTELAGQLAPSAGSHAMAGDQAGVVEWKTERKNSRGKWIYLRKYFHFGFVLNSDSDQLEPNTLGAYEDFATKLANASWPGNRQIRSQKQDETIQDSLAIPWVTTRTLHRRGKRP